MNYSFLLLLCGLFFLVSASSFNVILTGTKFEPSSFNAVLGDKVVFKNLTTYNERVCAVEPCNQIYKSSCLPSDHMAPVDMATNCSAAGHDEHEITLETLGVYYFVGLNGQSEDIGGKIFVNAELPSADECTVATDCRLITKVSLDKYDTGNPAICPKSSGGGAAPPQCMSYALDDTATACSKAFTNAISANEGRCESSIPPPKKRSVAASYHPCVYGGPRCEGSCLLTLNSTSVAAADVLQCINNKCVLWPVGSTPPPEEVESTTAPAVLASVLTPQATDEGTAVDNGGDGSTTAASCEAPKAIVTVKNACTGDMEDLCVEIAAEVCAQVITCGKSNNEDVVYEFPTACVPMGFTAVDSCECADDSSSAAAAITVNAVAAASVFFSLLLN